MNKITRIKVNDLFGFLEHDIPINQDGVTFIHGPNGCGKTTILKLITSFFEWDLSTLIDVNFSSIEIYYGFSNYVSIDKYSTKEIIEDEEIVINNLIFKIFENGIEKEAFNAIRNTEDFKVPFSKIDEFIPFIHQIGPRTWIDERTEEKLSYNEVVGRFAHRIPFFTNRKRPEWLYSIQENAKLHFIQTQRLLKVTNQKISHRDERNVSNYIEIYSNEIREKISEQLANSAAVSQSKDRSFPQRLLSLRLEESLSEEKIRNDYDITETKIQKLMESGLIEQEKNIALPSKKFEATEKKVLSLYLQDINEKLSVFDDLLIKIETFLSIISQKLRNKTFKVSQKEGFLIETTQGEYQKLKPTQLSSGEQHQIVLFYELIFKTGNNSFFLIDEPEISLHIDWQRQFLSDM